MSLFSKYTWLEAVGAESQLPLDNPWRGMYQLAKYLVADDADFSEEAIFAALDPTKKDTRLVLLEINICGYKAGDISPSGLNYVSAIFNAYRRTDKQLIVRFLYDWDGNGLLNEPAKFEVILRHMEQLGPILLSNTERILTHQGLFVGSWGEMHNSKFLSERWLRALVSKLHEATKGQVIISVRSPSLWRLCTGSETPDASAKHMLGIYNDGMLGSETDLGSYRHADMPVTSGKYTRLEEMAFQDKVGCLAPIGGEVVFGGEFSEFENASADFAQMRVSYLNRDYDAAVYSNWEKTETIDGIGGYDYIENRLGYRYVIRRTAIHKNNLTIKVGNVGFAPIYKQLEAELVLTNDAGVESLFELEVDTRGWRPGETINIDVPLASLGEDSVDIRLRLTDTELNEEIRIANATGGQLGRLAWKKEKRR